MLGIIRLLSHDADEGSRAVIVGDGQMPLVAAKNGGKWIAPGGAILEPPSGDWDGFRFLSVGDIVAAFDTE